MNWSEKQEQVKNCNLEWIKELGVPLEERGSQITVKIKNRKFIFWPYSDTWFSESRNKYGTDISKICRQIIEHLKSL